MEISVLGYPWNVHLVSPEEFKSRHGVGFAITDPDTKDIYFRTDEIKSIYITHELTHAFMYYMCMEEITLNPDDGQEFFCDFVGIHGPAIIKLSDEILVKLNQLNAVRSMI